MSVVRPAAPHGRMVPLVERRHSLKAQFLATSRDIARTSSIRVSTCGIGAPIVARPTAPRSPSTVDAGRGLPVRASLATTGAVGCFPILGGWDEISDALVRGLLSIRGLVVLAAWLGFVVAVVWMSRRARRRPLVVYDRRGSRLMTAQYTIFFSLLVHSLVFWRPQSDGALASAGVMLLALGTALYFRALPHLARGYNPMVCVREGQQVCTRGPYARVRHPSYAGQMLMMLGTALVTQHYDYLALPIPFYIMYRTALAEEALLAKHYGEYSGYRQRTWMFVPHLL
jgi:protein-S-isoprenylcysteine O-methyltransferase Ste14